MYIIGICKEYIFCLDTFYLVNELFVVYTRKKIDAS